MSDWISPRNWTTGAHHEVSVRARMGETFPDGGGGGR